MRALSFLLLAATSSLASVPPEVSVEEAVVNGGAAFVGRVVALWETERIPPLLLRAKARIVVSRCLYGRFCANKTITLEHVVEIGEEGLPLVLELGEQYLFVLRKDPGRSPEGVFDTEHTSGAFTSDMAWSIGRFSKDFSDDSGPETFSSTWFPTQGVPLTMAKILGWARQRTSPSGAPDGGNPNSNVDAGTKRR